MFSYYQLLCINEDAKDFERIDWQTFSELKLFCQLHKATPAFFHLKLVLLFSVGSDGSNLEI